MIMKQNTLERMVMDAEKSGSNASRISVFIKKLGSQWRLKRIGVGGRSNQEFFSAMKLYDVH